MAVSYLDIVYVCFILKRKTYLVRKMFKVTILNVTFEKKTHSNNIKITIRYCLRVIKWCE